MEQKTLLSALGRTDARAPRYTSYPPASSFSPAVGAAQMAAWLEAVPAGATVSLYVHVPFCRRLCWFCACRTQGTQTDRPLRAYVETLEAELALVARHLAPSVRVAHLHLGGGTPTILPPQLLRQLGEAITSRWLLVEGAEVSVEIDPTEIDAARMDALAELGMTRASVGVQDVHPEVQAAIGRLQDVAATRWAVEAARDRGVRSLNMDLLYGLPGQTEARLAATVEQVLALSPDRVALYGYAHVPWMSRRQQLIDEAALPGAGERLGLFETAASLFLWDGYQRVGIDHFARPEDGLARAQKTGRLRRNFQGYTDDPAEVLIGIGASAISRFPHGYAQNAAATGAHAAAVRGGSLATHRGHAFEGEDRARATAIERLMCDFRFDRAAVLAAGGIAPAELERLMDRAVLRFPALVARDAGGLAILPDGRPLTRVIASLFDGYETAPERHSQAV
jgi:oxygen-independent coproporphyrinogen III oxidase